MKLELNAIEALCVIGDLPEEREKPQPLRVDISLEIPDAAAYSDDLADTVDYAALADAVRAALTAAKCRMIERAAKVAADVCMADSRVLSADVKVVKTGAVKGLGSAAAVISVRRTEASS